MTSPRRSAPRWRPAEHLIVIASPASARSAYVEREIREFAAINRKRARPGRILTLIVDGEPNADDPRQECLPAALRGGLAAEDGAPVEPLAADARPTGDGKTRALAKLVAGMLGVRYDALVRRDLQRRRRLHAAIAATVCVAALIASGVAWKFEADRREREQLAQARAQAESERRTVTAVSNAEHAKVMLAAGNVEGAVKLAGASLPDDGSLPFIPQAYATLYDTYINSGVPVDLEVLDMPADDSFTTPLSDGTWLSWTDPRRRENLVADARYQLCHTARPRTVPQTERHARRRCGLCARPPRPVALPGGGTALGHDQHGRAGRGARPTRDRSWRSIPTPSSSAKAPISWSWRCRQPATVRRR